MKKYLAILLALVMVFSLAACGGDKDPAPSGNGDNTPSSSQQEQTTKPNDNSGDKEALVNNVGDTASYGTYNEQAIEWLALAVDKENEKALLVSKDAVAMMPFDGDDPYSSDWESSTIRTWLNNDFVNTAFTSEEASKILTTTISVVANSEYGTIGGSPTTDKVFLLSEEEINRYFPDGESRCINYEYEDGTDLADWWTITPGEDSGRAVVILAEGTILTDGYAVGTELGIRPTIWINLSDETAGNDTTQPEQGGNSSAGEVRDFTVGIEGVPAEWQKAIGTDMFGMETSGGNSFSTGFLQKFSGVSAEDFNKLIAYFDTLTYTEKLDGVYNCDWGQIQIAHNADASEMTVTWYVK